MELKNSTPFNLAGFAHTKNHNATNSYMPGPYFKSDFDLFTGPTLIINDPTSNDRFTRLGVQDYQNYLNLKPNTRVKNVILRLNDQEEFFVDADNPKINYGAVIKDDSHLDLSLKNNATVDVYADENISEHAHLWMNGSGTVRISGPKATDLKVVTWTLKDKGKNIQVKDLPKDKDSGAYILTIEDKLPEKK